MSPGHLEAVRQPDLCPLNLHCCGLFCRASWNSQFGIWEFYLAASAMEGQTRRGEHKGRAALTAHASLLQSLPVGAGWPRVFPGRESLSQVRVLHHVPLACLLRYREPKGLNKCVVRAQPQLPSPWPRLVRQLKGKEPSSGATRLRCAQQAAGVLRGTAPAGARLVLASLPVSPQPL